ncbi:MAG: hypothetical protein ACLQDF_13560 [Desulfomonilia bacterium]
MQENNTMECTIQWMRKCFTGRIASTIHALGAGAGASVPVHAPYTNPLMFVAVDMAQKNSVIAVYSKHTCTEDNMQCATDAWVTRIFMSATR